jgi:hypothetical protein
VPEPGHEQSMTSGTPPAITAISTDSSRQFGNVSLTRNLA